MAWQGTIVNQTTITLTTVLELHFASWSAVHEEPVEFPAPEVAVGLRASPANDIRTLGCSIFRLRSGEAPFSGYKVTSPGDLMRVIIQTLGVSQLRTPTFAGTRPSRA